MKSLIPPGINRTRLKYESIVVIIIVLLVLSPWILSLPARPSPEKLYRKYNNLYSAVERYDYSKGPSPALEARISRSLDNGSSSIQYYYNLKAKVAYYYHIGNYSVAKRSLKAAYQFAPYDAEIEYLDNISHRIGYDPSAE